ncbi:MAG: septum formation inhibitor Maf [Desulfamplus sp.]|nr:septum formation inhibitor Maf [Desulfamplus sp.]
MKNITIQKLTLASQSPRRKELLEQAGVDFEIMPADIEEIVMPSELPDDYVKRLSREKAQFVAERVAQQSIVKKTVVDKNYCSQNNTVTWVLGADTTVVMGDILLEKPTSDDDARKMLQTLSGKTHIVYTGFTLCCQSEGKVITRSVKTDVLFKNLTVREIDWYISTREPFDKAGGYAIQGLGAFMVKSINGSYSNVVGLPVCEVMEILMQERIIAMG